MRWDGQPMSSPMPTRSDKTGTLYMCRTYIKEEFSAPSVRGSLMHGLSDLMYSCIEQRRLLNHLLAASFMQVFLSV
jgi:hypothetical protein